mgnify:CR=1 FL=1
MLEKNDWRLVSQQEYLMNADLKKEKYSQPTENWDHDHCAFCWNKFSYNPEDLNMGYCTKDKKHWICEECFNDFKEMFNFKIIHDNSVDPYKF